MELFQRSAPGSWDESYWPVTNRSGKAPFGNLSIRVYIWNVTRWPSSPNGKRALIASLWVMAVAAIASQWYVYDAIHHHSERFTYYLLTCAYLCGVLTPVVLSLGARYPIESRSWKRFVPIHVTASLLLTGVGVFVEASTGWLPHAGDWPFSSALQHYFRQHTQISLLVYWALLAAVHIYRMHDRARLRELHAAQLEAQLTEAQLTALRIQLQPHFLFNTLQAATMLIYDDPEGAEEILLSLSELLRISLQALQRQEVPLRNEIEFLKHYAAIQHRRFGDRLRFEFHFDEQSQYCAIPSLLLQPLVENAIRHGIAIRKQPDVVTVHAVVDRDRLNIEVTNYASVLDDSPEKLLSRGVGIANTIARLERLYGRGQSFAIRSLEPQGVEVSLSIPARLLPLAVNELEAQAV